MTDGTYSGLDDAAIIELLTTTSAQNPDQPDSDDGPPDDDRGPGRNEPDTEGPDGGGIDDSGPNGAGEPADGADDDEVGECRSSASGTATTQPDRTTVETGLELRVRLSTLLRRDQYPAELAGWGPVHAELVRDLAVTLGGAQWRFAITDELGQLVHCGITAARPNTAGTRAAACRAIVELQVPATALRALSKHHTGPGAWADVVTDLARQLHQATAGEDRYTGDTDRRTPGAALRRYLEIRDQYCTMIGCRAPARTADKDHTHDHSHGGPTTTDNLGDACRHDHRLKHEGGWQIHQPQAGHFRWTSPLGHSYHRRPPRILEPLPDPIPRDLLLYPVTLPLDDGWEATEIWEDPPRDPEPDPPPEPNPNDDIPPF